MIEIIHRVLFVLLIAKLLMTMYQRRFMDVGAGKRLVSLYQSLLLGVVYIAVSVIISQVKPDYLVYLVLLLGVITGVLLRAKLFPYQIVCNRCQSRYKLDQILFVDHPKCRNCH